MMATVSVGSEPPIGVAWTQALASIRVRFWRHSLTASGIALGTAFFASVLTLRATELHAGQADVAALSRLTWLAATSLGMCLVGVTNSMLISVSERYREIGTMKCLGATNAFIVRVFFLEALLLGLLGAGAGSVLGAALMGSVLSLTGYDVPSSGPLLGIPLALSVGLVLTLAAAVAPAMQASKMAAVAALRVEV